MISAATAKALFFVAMSLAPQGARQIYATSNSDNYIWTHQENGWTLRTKGLPSEDWVGKGSQPDSDPDRDLKPVAAHHWTRQSGLDLRSGDRVEKQGDAAFYIVSPGAPNEKVFTILYSEK